MDLSVAFPTQGDQIVFGIMAQLASAHNVVNFQSSD
jgi:hypothetical protein